MCVRVCECMCVFTSVCMFDWFGLHIALTHYTKLRHEGSFCMEWCRRHSSKQLNKIVLRTFYILHLLRTVIPGSEFYPQRRNSGADIRKKMNCHIRRRLMINEFMKICAIVSMAIYHRYTESVIRVIEGQSIVEPQKHVQAIKNTYLHSLFPVG